MRNQVEEKKKDELIILELFRERYPDFPKGIINATESPDFILSMGPKNKVGIELTRLHQHLPGSDPFAYENLAACLEVKDEKIQLYRKKKLQEYWLILAVLDPAFRPRFNLHNKLIKWRFNSAYNRIFLFNVLSGEVFTLKKEDQHG